MELLLDDKKDELTGNKWVATTVEKMEVTSGDSPTVQSGRLLDKMMVYAKVTWTEYVMVIDSVFAKGTLLDPWTVD